MGMLPRRPWLSPVGWLLGPDLLGALKKIATAALFGRKLDPRHWMRAQVLTAEALRSGPTQGQDGLWFDYLSDSGDGQRATYAVARLAMADVWLEGAAVYNAPGRWHKPAETTPSVHLPRGEFLVLGGDTAYHVADRKTLLSRFVEPFRRAEEDTRTVLGSTPTIRPILAIPGNHDYYDSLDGFRQLFLAGPSTIQATPSLRGTEVADTSAPSVLDRISKAFEVMGEGADLALEVPAFRTLQTASYFALQLVGGWWLYALDTEAKWLDTQQRSFFKFAPATLNEPAPRKLIVVSSKPTTVLGRKHRKEDPSAVPFEALGMQVPLEMSETRPDSLGGACRVDIAGDTHHYARYYGKKTPIAAGEEPETARYVSVVSGLGGAFLHPTHTDHGEIQPKAIYPERKVSYQNVVRRLGDPRTVFGGGYVFVVGFLFAWFVSAAAAARWGFLHDAAATLAGLPIHPETWYPNGVSALLPVGVLLLGLTLLMACLLGAVAVPNLLEKYWDRSKLYFYFPSILLLIVGGTGYTLLQIYAETINSRGLTLDAFIALLFATFLLTIGVVLPWIGFSRHTPFARVGFVGLGIVHALAQALFPLLLLHSTSADASGLGAIGSLLVSVGGLLVMRRLAWRLATWKRLYRALFVSILALVVLALAFRLPSIFGAEYCRVWTLLEGDPQTGVAILISRALATDVKTAQEMMLAPLAGLIGLVTTSIWLSWYLLVADAWNGHNNEVGGAARVGAFRQIVRFHVTHDHLTGYVIAAEDGKTPEDELKLRLVDVFRVGPRGTG